MAGDELTREEVVLRRVLLLLGFVLGCFVIHYVLEGVVGGAEFPFVANSAAKDSLFFILCIVAANDVRRFGWAVWVIIIGHTLLVGALLAALISGKGWSIAATLPPIFGLPMMSAHTYLLVWLGAATAITVIVAFCGHRALRSRYPLRYLSQLQHRTLASLAEVLVMDKADVVTPDEIANRVDDYLYGVDAHEKWKAKLALMALTFYPLLRFRPPYGFMSPLARQRFIEKCFIADVAERRLPSFLRRPLQTALVAAQQLAFMGYYGDPRTGASSGYVPFTERPEYYASMDRVSKDRPGLSVRTPRELDSELVEADVVVIGSGAAGATVAERLLERGRDVLILERGKHVDPSQFEENEMKMFSTLYADGAFQMSRDARFQVLQGRCVGGSTVVNNAVCFRLPEHAIERWNDKSGLNAGLDETAIAASFAHLEAGLPVNHQENNERLNPGARKFVEGVKALGLDKAPGKLEVVKANIEDCLGCGYCNYGCPYGKKLSMLDTVLPRAQGTYGKDRLRIFSECRVDRIEGAAKGVGDVLCELPGGRRLQVRARTVVLAAGAIASSLILQRSNLGGPKVGTGLGFNIAAPMHAEFDEKLDSYAGLQISHTLRPAGEDDLVMETWFNPVGAESLFMPGWFSDHYRNMRRYDHMACVGVVVGSHRNATVRPGRFGKGMRLDYEPVQDDLRLLVKGLRMTGKAFLAADALKVMTTTFRYMPCKTEADLDAVDEYVRDNTDIALQSAHPQGGNAMSANPAKGVVDPQYAVHGVEGLYVCDASVFPSPITVNPQLTVMALAHHAGGLIAEPS
ncbi:MAG: hypothetical protein QOG62_2437 [Thermoleophilaceae bacterium]|jgi:choline dehydrogenase-like flavoprotein|nr:hypothetical protein [Thermoleophilaceae bacterium]